ncbi:MAG TPA: DUF4238 domain-containing protein [Sphingomicrobium sp.]|nr:DUF4238 domain-containing protein [Sphingomicrobium sp.]
MDPLIAVSLKGASHHARQFRSVGGRRLIGLGFTATYLLGMSKQAKPSKKHHYVPQAQLRHFASDADGKSIWVYDKGLDRSWVSSLLNAGSENDFNTVELKSGKWNFEDIFQDVDGRSARLISEVVSRRTLSWLTPADHAAMIDLFTTQMLRTRLARSTPQSLAIQMREMMRDIGIDPDADPSLATPTEAVIRVGAVKSFLQRDKVARSMVRLVPALFAAGDGHRFIISDDPVIRRNAFPYGDHGLESHGIMVFLPIAADLSLVLLCPTIISRYEAVEQADMEREMRARMLRYRDGFRTGTPVTIETGELKGWNRCQARSSASQLYASADEDFEVARALLAEQPELRKVETRLTMGRMGQGPPPKPGLPPGLQLVIQGKFDHAILPIAEIDKSEEGLTARTTSIDLLELIAADRHEMRADLYDDGRLQRGIGKATVERIGEPRDGWFRVVHMDKGLRNLARRLGS